MRYILVLFLLFANTANAYVFSTSAPYVVVMDYNSNTIIFERNSNEVMVPSSMSKLMTLYLMFGKVRAGTEKFTNVYRISEHAASHGGSSMFLRAGQPVTVKQLIRGAIIVSGNDACVALAEGSSGSEENFVKEMNDMATTMGLKKTHFANPTGWPDSDHYMSAQDLVKLAVAIIDDFPEYYHLFSETELTFNGVKQYNRNELLNVDLGVDGLKTGFTSTGGYGVIVSAKQGHRRLIMLVNGLNTHKERQEEANKILQYAFENFASETIFNKGDAIDNAKVWMGQELLLPLTINSNITLTYDKNLRDKIAVSVKYDTPIRAPIYKNQKIGVINIEIPGQDTQQFDLVAKNEVRGLSSIGKLVRRIANVF